MTSALDASTVARCPERALKWSAFRTMIGPLVRRVSSSIFVGRVAERAQLESALDAAARAEPGLVLIGGEAGIGKTRLTRHAVSAAIERSAVVARGHCVQTTAVTLPFAPFIEILRELLRGNPRIRGALDDGAVAQIARLVPDVARHELPPAGADDENRMPLFHAVLETVRQGAKEQALVLVLEDLHWADGSSLDMLRFVVGSLAAERVLVVATFRTDEPSETQQLPHALAELVRLPIVARVNLEPFGEREVKEQLTGIAGRPPAPDVARRIHARSGGNPFIVEELAGQSGTGLPETLREVMAVRLGALSPNTRATVEAVAAIGREADGALLGIVTAVGEQELQEAVREALERHVLARTDRADDTYQFRHALIGEFVYENLLAPRRLQLHRATLRALQDLGGSSAELARHARLAGELPLALEQSVIAAERARASLGFEEALAHAEDALRLWSVVGDPGTVTHRDLPWLLRFAAQCAVAVGSWDEATTLGRWALAGLGPDDQAARLSLLLDLADWHQYADDDLAHKSALGEAAELAPIDPPNRERARVLTELAYEMADEGRSDDAQRMAGDAVEVARAAGAPTEEVRALIAVGVLSREKLRHREADRAYTEAARVVTEAGVTEEYVVATLAARRSELAVEVGDYHRALELVDAGLARSAKAGTLDQQRPFLRWRRILCLRALGRWVEAEALVTEGERDSTVWQHGWTLYNFLDVLIRQGRWDEADAVVRRIGAGKDLGYWTPMILHSRMKLAFAQGRWADARSAAEETIGLPNLWDDVLYPLLEDSVRGEADRADAAHARRRVAEEADARRIGREQLELFRAFVGPPVATGGAGPLVEAGLARAEAEGSRLDGHSDPALWDDAARRREQLGERWDAAYARFRQSEALLAQRGDRQTAVGALEAANRAAVELGARPLLEQIEVLGRRARIQLVPTTPAARRRRALNADGVLVSLTAREWEVLGLVAAGHTNREIGDQLFISEKTVSVHVTNAMNKLGALSRYDAAASATRLGLLPAQPDGRPT